MAKVTGSHLIVKALELEGVRNIFLIAGDHILPVLDVMADRDFRLVDVRHEQAAVHMADAWGRLTDRPGVCMYTTPGFANALPGLAHAWHAESPVLSISGCAPLAELGRGAMQEIDQVGAARPFTKGAWLVPDARRIPDYIARALRTAFSGRRGPVHLTIPTDVQDQVVDDEAVAFYPPAEYRLQEHTAADPSLVQGALAVLQGAQRPIAIAGGPAGYTQSGEALQRLIETAHIPLFTEEQVRGLVSDDHPLVFGFFERGINRAARLLSEADAVLLLGRKQDYSISYLAPPSVAPDAKVVQVDPSPEVIGVNRGVAVGLVGEVQTVVAQLADAASKLKWDPHDAWLEKLRAARAGQAEWTKEMAQPAAPMHALYVHTALGGLLRPDDSLVFDGGDFCHHGRSFHKARLPRRWFYLPTIGLLGSALPTALAVKLAHPERRVIAFTGDGAFGFNAMEFDTALRHNLPVVMVLGNDAAWGIDRHIQIGVYGRPTATDLVQRRYDKVVEGLGGHGEYVERPEELVPAFERALASGKPALLNVAIQKAISPRAEASIARIKAGLKR